MRIRSGFVGNVIGFGVKHSWGDSQLVAYASLWSLIENPERVVHVLNRADVREAYVKADGPWGSCLAGRALTLFDRGASETEFLYLHGYGLGYPGSISIRGPGQGLIGFGVLDNGFAAGIVYASPPIVGVQLTVGLYDPASLVGSYTERTKALRPEFELTVDEHLGSLGSVHLYFNGTEQGLYQTNAPDKPSETAKGTGFGGRLEMGPLHLAAGGHRGIGLGLTFALEPSASTFNGTQFRDTEGYFGMLQVAIGRFDLNAGYGRTLVKPLDIDLRANSSTGYPTYSLIYTQTGAAAAIVFHLNDILHFDFDVMHADFRWTLGDRQRISFYNLGATATW
jgi:hypothetical protein